MIKKLYPCPSFEGIDGEGDEIYFCFYANYDEKLGGFPTSQFIDVSDIVCRGSYDFCCEFLDRCGS